MLLRKFRNARHRFADGVIAHQRNTIISAAGAVVEILFPTKIGTPIGQIGNILLLYPFPHSFSLCRRIVQSDFCPNLLLAWLGVQNMAGTVN